MKKVLTKFDITYKYNGCNNKNSILVWSNIKKFMVLIFIFSGQIIGENGSFFINNDGIILISDIRIR